MFMRRAKVKELLSGIEVLPEFLCRCLALLVIVFFY